MADAKACRSGCFSLRKGESKKNHGCTTFNKSNSAWSGEFKLSACVELLWCQTGNRFQIRYDSSNKLLYI